MPIVIRDENGTAVGGNVSNPGPAKPKSSGSGGITIPLPDLGKLGSGLVLLVGFGILALIMLSKLSAGLEPRGHTQAPRPVEGYELTAPNPPYGTVVVRGMVQYVKKARTSGVILEMRAEDGTPFTAFAGPDVVLPTLRGRDRIALTGKLQTDLFLVTDVRREPQLSERIKYYVAHTKNGWAYVQEGRSIKKYPLPANFNGETIVVSYYGKRVIVEAE